MIEPWKLYEIRDISYEGRRFYLIEILDCYLNVLLRIT